MSPPLIKIRNLLITNPLFADFPERKSWYAEFANRVKLYLNIKQQYKQSNERKFIIEMAKASSAPEQVSIAWQDGEYTVESTFVQYVSAIMDDICSSEPYSSENKKSLKKTIHISLINPEEVRNIVGDEGKSHPINAICENSYRLAYNEYHAELFKFTGETFSPLKLRYGHNNTPCKVTKNVLDWIKSRATRGLEVCHD